MELDEIDALWARHPAWRLLRLPTSPLILSFLGTFFIDANRGATGAAIVTTALDDALYAIHRVDPERYRASPETYLKEWSSPESGALRRFYPAGSEEVHFEATPALERAVRFIDGLQERSFVGTESRVNTLIELLRQIVHGSQADPAARILELERRREAIDAELAEAREGRFSVLGDTAIRERYQQFAAMARELLSDFREVEENFRALDRTAREKIAGWEGGKGELLSQLVTDRSGISTSDQGQSFQAFYDFLLSERRQDELSELLAIAQSLPEISADRRLRTIHHDWADAAERTQQTVRTLSEQLRRFLEDQVWVENRRVLDLVRSIESAALAVRDRPPSHETGMVIDEARVPISLLFERPLYDPRPEIELENMPGPRPLDEIELEGLFAQRFVDSVRLAGNIRAVVPPRSSAELDDIVGLYPLEEGAAELLGYLSLSEDDIAVEIGDGRTVIDYVDIEGTPRRVGLPSVRIVRR